MAGQQAKTEAPFWLNAVASMASVTMLLVISSYNVVPTIRRAIDGDTPAIGLAAVQIAFTIFLAIIPFVPDWSADTRKWLSIAFMIGNGYFAYEIAGHRHDAEQTAVKQHAAWVAELDGEDGKIGKRSELAKLGEFKPASDREVDFADEAAKKADAAAEVARAAFNAAKAQSSECRVRCAKLENEATRLGTEATKLDVDANKAHDDLKAISANRTLTETAAALKARIDFLQNKLTDEKFVAVTGSSTETGRTIEAGLIAFLIEVGNRFGPEGIFKFLIAAAAALSTRSPSVTEDVDYKPSPVALTAAPHVEQHIEPIATMEPDAVPTPQVASEAPAFAPGRRPGVMTEVPSWEDQPDAPKVAPVKPKREDDGLLPAREESIGEWIEDGTTENADAKYQHTDLYRFYTLWCRSRGESPIGPRKFAEVLDNTPSVQRTIGKHKKVYYSGIAPKRSVLRVVKTAATA